MARVNDNDDDDVDDDDDDDGGGGGGGGGGDDDEEIAQMRRQLEEGDRELSWMRGQLEEAKHTVMRAAELEQQRRKAADEFKRDQQQASAFGYGQGSGESQQQQQQQQQPARPLDFGGRPPPTRETLMEREKELSQLRAALDEAGNEVVANLRKYDEMYAQLDGLYGAEREQLTAVLGSMIDNSKEGTIIGCVSVRVLLRGCTSMLDHRITHLLPAEVQVNDSKTKLVDVLVDLVLSTYNAFLLRFQLPLPLQTCPQY